MAQFSSEVLTLIGYRGTGKTTVARLLATRLGWEWKDADAEVECRARRSIAEIFAEEGEAGFRRLETQVLAELLSHKQMVLAAGGGAVLRPENRRRMGDAGTVVWLRSDPKTIAKRIASDETTASRRPDLTSQGGLQEIVNLLAARTPLYASCADLQIETAGKTPPEVVDEIVASWTVDR